MSPELRGQFFRKKGVADFHTDNAHPRLRRVLGRMSLVNVGIGAIIGAGIFVLTGHAAAANAGPAVTLSFIVAGIACALAALCYAELASSIPVCGSAYSYAYCTMGEGPAWIMGWLLLLEYGIAAAAVAVGWSGYLVSLLGDFGLEVPRAWTASTLEVQRNDSGDYVLNFAGTANGVAALGMIAVAALLILGVRESARLNNITVVLKLCILVAFVAIGVPYINPDNWTPFVPENTGRFGDHGVSGILRAAGIIFFAYVGFEAVSTAADEARDPQRDVPAGILGSLAACTVIYVLVAVVLTGVVPYGELGVSDPIALAAARISPSWASVPFFSAPGGELNLFSIMIKTGAVAGLTTVMLVLCYGQTRIFFTMAGDGLMPRAFSVVHPSLGTPWIGTSVLCGVIGIASAMLPVMVLADLVNLGAALAFAMVCYAVLRLRSTHPELKRPFRAPGGAWVPILGLATSLVLAMLNLLPMLQSAEGGDPVPLMILAGYLLVGVVAYVCYGMSNSVLGREARQQ